MNRDTAIIIPVYNEAAVIRGVVDEALAHFDKVICVDDGSSDASVTEVSQTVAKVIRHPINLGQGAAIQTGIEYALRDPEVEYFVTFDADGQHSIHDVEKMLAYIREHHVDVVLGSRFLERSEHVPTLKRILLKAAVWFSNSLSGLDLTDAHNGLRVFNRAVAEALDITMSDMAHASEIIDRIAQHDFRYKELPVTIAYTDYSRAKGQPWINAVNISVDVLAARVSRR